MESNPESKSVPRAWWWFVLAALLLLPVVWFTIHLGTRSRLEALAPEERAELFRATLTAFRTECVGREPIDLARCRENAAFLLEFPECDRACHSVADPFVARGAK